MLDHAPSAFSLPAFLEAVPRVRNAELYYAAIAFFVEEEPASLGKLLSTLQAKLDHGRVVHQLRKIGAALGADDGGPTGLLALTLPYLKAVQVRRTWEALVCRLLAPRLTR